MTRNGRFILTLATEILFCSIHFRTEQYATVYFILSTCAAKEQSIVESFLALYSETNRNIEIAFALKPIGTQMKIKEYLPQT